MDDLGGDPPAPEVDQGLHWHDREPCPFTREEGEVYGTYVASSRNEGDDSMTHWADNYAAVGRTRIISTSPTEARIRTAVKVPSKKTNNRASFGGSILKNNMEVEAAMELQRHLDESGVLQVYTIYVGGILGFKPGLPKFAFLKQVHRM